MAEHHALDHRWQRLVHALYYCHLPGLPTGGPGGVLDVEQYLQLIRTGLPTLYSRPRALTTAEQAEHARLTRRAQQLLSALHSAMRVPPYQSDARATALWEDVTSRIEAQRSTVWQRANPGRKRRYSRRRAVQRYVSEVATFCTRWNLQAWWAVPAVIDSHFRRIMLAELTAPEPDQFGRKANNKPRRAMLEPDLLLNGVIGRVAPIQRETIIARLPIGDGPPSPAGEAQPRSLMMATVVNEGTPSAVRVNRRPRENELLSIAREQNLLHVRVDWDGRAHYWSEQHRGRRLTLTEFLAEQCELRLGEPLTIRQERALQSQIQPQVQTARARFLEQGFRVEAGADLEIHARWVARRLLNPEVGYEKIAVEEAKRNPNPPGQSSVREACVAFAQAAGLNLPPLPLRSPGAPVPRDHW